MPPIEKDVRSLGMPWETSAIYSQAMKVGDTIYISGQLGHDEKGELVGPDMESQTRRTYANIEKLLQMYGAGLDNLVQQVIFVTDIPKAVEVLGPVRAELFKGIIPPTDTLVEVRRLAFETQMIEINCIAKV